MFTSFVIVATVEAKASFENLFCVYKKDWKTAWATTFLRRKRNTFSLKNLNIHLMSHAYQIYIMGKTRFKLKMIARFKYHMDFEV